jgi:hypothetical protein
MYIFRGGLDQRRQAACSEECSSGRHVVHLVGHQRDKRVPSLDRLLSKMAQQGRADTSAASVAADPD